MLNKKHLYQLIFIPTLIILYFTIYPILLNYLFHESLGYVGQSDRPSWNFGLWVLSAILVLFPIFIARPLNKIIIEYIYEERDLEENEHA